MMRGGEAILGGLLVMSSFAGVPWLSSVPGVQDVLEGTEEVGVNVTGQAEFLEANYTGSASVQASEAALRTVGGYDVQIEASDVQVKVVRRTEASLGVRTNTDPNAGAGRSVWDPSESHEVSTYEKASLQLAGNPDALLVAWPKATGKASFDLDLSPQRTPALSARNTGVDFLEAGKHATYDLDGPVFGLGHGVSSYHTVSLESAVFDSLNATGALTFLVDGGLIKVEQDNQTDRFDTTDRWSHETPEDIEPGRAEASASVRQRVFAVVTLREGRTSMDFDGVRSSFFAHEPTWSINGTVSLDVQDGQLRVGGDNRSIEEDTVRVEGRTVLGLDARHQEGGDPPEEPLERNHLFGYTRPPPKINSTLSSEADNVTINGQPMQTSEEPALPEEVTFWGKVVGLLLLAWSVGKKFLVFVASLFIEDPLDNERRRQVYDFLDKSGLAYLREIHRATGIPIASLKYHLRVLRRAGLLASFQRAGNTVYFPTNPELSRDEMYQLAMLAQPTRREIAEALVDRGEATQSQLAELLGLTRATISRQIGKLVDAELVKEEGSHNIVYRPVPLLEKWMTTA